MKAQYPRQKKTCITVRPVIEGLEPRMLLSAYALNAFAFFTNAKTVQTRRAA